jgi:RNA polymerase II-associated factor 1
VPDVPYDMKFLKYPFERDRFIKYKPTSLERYYMHDILKSRCPPRTYHS